MSYPHQDWTPVVFHKRQDTLTREDAVKLAHRTGRPVETVEKDHHREERDRARKLEDGTAVLPKLSIAMRNMMRDARTKMNITREELARQLNVKPKVISDLESGLVVTDASVLQGVKRILKLPALRFGNNGA
jgi:ribosome-binding protein aMBF1 (putative translation factor)